jgi:tRNA (Thr-GGU) A37 N-methylase
MSIEKNVIQIDEIDSFDGTPVIDIKPCTSKADLTVDMRVPEWAKD